MRTAQILAEAKRLVWDWLAPSAVTERETLDKLVALFDAPAEANIFDTLRLADVGFTVIIDSFPGNAGFRVRLGDEMNGWKADVLLRTWEEVEVWLREKMGEHFGTT